MSGPTIKKVSNEGAEIYCERRGDGPMLLLIHGAMEDAGFYSSSADLLAEEFTVVTYDRRCNSRSSGNRSSEMIVAQQARDAAVVIKSICENKKATVLGRSGGAIISLELAAIRPELIDFLIIHEAPVIKLLLDSEARRWHAFMDGIYLKYQREGWQAAQIEFMASLVNVPDSPYPPDLNERLVGNVDFFFKHEFRNFYDYLPEIECLSNSRINMVTATGRESDGAYYVQATKALAASLGCENIEFPGHHDVSFWMPKEFAEATRQAIKQNRHSITH
jgi:pimeloyl-ACP methyl ester carboxylesterase